MMGRIIERELGMKDTEGATVVTARLPSGAPIRVKVAGTRADDAKACVGLRHLEINTR